MDLSFYKYHGTGNDFILINNLDGRYSKLAASQIKFLCNRRIGIGADGLMLLNHHPHYDFEMKYFNADGLPGSMCGNGGRCIVQFAYSLGMKQNEFRFVAPDGEHEAKMDIEKRVSLKMADVDQVHFKFDHYILNTGSPHFVKFVDHVHQLNVEAEGSKIRNSRDFAEKGINVNFVEDLGKNSIYVRTFERGVEAETLSCGTGVTAAALLAAHNENGFNSVEVRTKGGELTVEFEKVGEHSFRNIWLWGAVTYVYKGEISLKEPAYV